MNFLELGLAEKIVDAVTAAGYTSPTPIQQQAIPHVLAERDVLGCAQTGTGKTAAFALPILHRLLNAKHQPPARGRKIRVLVLSPTRELASQIAASFRDYGKFTALRQTTIFGGVNQFNQVKALNHGIDILVATPGRLLDLLEQGHVDLRSVEILVIDEADRMFDMGFLPDVRRILSKVPPARQTLLFSATMVPEVEQLASAVLVNPVQIRIVPCQTTTALIEQSVCFVSQSAKLELLAHYLSQAITTRTVVFTRTKHGADRVVRKLAERNISAMAIHGNKSQNARERALSAFKSDRVPVLVATDVAARGIDIDNISHVFNYDLPEDPKTYLHRIGRTGRAGANGIAISFCDPDERRYLRDIEKTIRQPLPPRNDVPTHLPTSATATSPGHTSPSNPPRRAESRRAESQRTSSRREATQPRETGKTSQVHAAHPRGEFRAVAPKFAATQGNEAKRKFRKKFKSRGTTKASGSSVPAPHARPAKSKKFRSSRPSSR